LNAVKYEDILRNEILPAIRWIIRDISSIVRRVLTQELRGECGEGGYSGARGITSRGERV